MSNATVPSLKGALHGWAAVALFGDNPNGPPNLDALATDAGTYRAAAQVLSAMAEYCDLISLAHDARSSGRITEALKLESRAERIYDLLPAGARW